MSDTIATMLTSSGRSAVATVAIAGSDALSSLMARFRPATASVSDLVMNKIYFGTWHWDSYQEELVVCRVAEEQFEVHCHGGRLASQTILDSLAELGTCVISSTEWLDRNLSDRCSREAIELLRLATTEKPAAILLDQSRHAMRRALFDIQTLIENEKTDQAIFQLEQIESFGKLGIRITRPFSVVLFGAPNTGKSSLVNALMGFERAIVCDMPGTTRDAVSASTALNGWPITLTDTAGMRSTNDPIERAGIKIAEQQLKDADLILVIQDLSNPSSLAWPSHVDAPKSIRVGTKADLGNSAAVEVDVITSVTQGTGIDMLGQQIVAELVPHAAISGSAVPVTAWQLECITSLLSLLRNNRSHEAMQLIADLFS